MPSCRQSAWVGAACQARADVCSVVETETTCQPVACCRVEGVMLQCVTARDNVHLSHFPSSALQAWQRRTASLQEAPKEGHKAGPWQRHHPSWDTAGCPSPRGQERGRNGVALDAEIWIQQKTMFSFYVKSLPEMPEREQEPGKWGREFSEEEVGGRIHLPSSLASVSIFPFHQQKTVCTIAAHEGTLAAITFNASGSKLASASEKVSVPRVLTGSPPARGRRLPGVCWMAPAVPGI